MTQQRRIQLATERNCLTPEIIISSKPTADRPCFVIHEQILKEKSKDFF